MSADATGSRIARDQPLSLSARLTAALSVLRRSRRGHAYLAKPWYLVIGPPGAGKTAAIQHAGLRFALTAELGNDPAATRGCDLWLAEQAVLLDTAGRALSRDRDWDTFLDLLKPVHPLSGIVVVIPVTDLALAPPEEPRAIAESIRHRIDTVQRRLGARPPVHLLLTKADLIAGFSEFFADLDASARAQPLGGPPPPTFSTLNSHLFIRLANEPDPQRRARAALFPGQVASLQQPLSAFCAEAFPSPPRGVYLCSAVQEGWPFDRGAGLAKLLFGLETRRPAAQKPEPGHGFFLEGVFRDVILARPRAQPNRTLPFGFAILALCVAAAGGGLWHYRQTGKARIAERLSELQAYREAANSLPPGPVGDGDAQSVIPLLDAAAHDATLYRHALQFALFPRLLWQAETQLRANLSTPDTLYPLTRLYLMLGSQGPIDRAFVLEWATTVWPSPDLRPHLDALLSSPLPAVTLDQPLVASARAALATISTAQRAYARIKLLPQVRGLPPWRPADALGRVGVALFVRSSGKPLTDGIPGLFTPDGFHRVVLPSLARVARIAAEDDWVTGQRIAIETDAGRLATLQREIIGLYENDYAQAWDSMLADLNLVPLESISRAAQDLYILESPQSPLRSILLAVAQQTTLSPAPGSPGHEIDERYATLRALVGTAGGPVDIALRSLNDMQQQFARAAASGTGARFDGPDPAVAVKIEALRQPQPLSRWLVTLADSATALRTEVRR